MRSRRNSICLWTVVYGLCSIIAGCGYTNKAIVVDNVRSIHVEIFKNDIDVTKEVSAKDKYELYRPNLEVDVRDKIIERLFLDGNLRLSQAGDADAVLAGDIIEYRREPLRYRNEDVTEYKISLVCDIRLTRNSKDREVLFNDVRITGDTTYFTTGSLQKSETQALDEAIEDLARRIVNTIVEDW